MHLERRSKLLRQWLAAQTFEQPLDAHVVRERLDSRLRVLDELKQLLYGVDAERLGDVTRQRPIGRALEYLRQRVGLEEIEVLRLAQHVGHEREPFGRRRAFAERSRDERVSFLQ